MSTLLDGELFSYLDYLEEEIDKQITENQSVNSNLCTLVYTQFKEIIKAEKEFLSYTSSAGTHPVLSITLNGLPSVDSLVPDLRKMCELSQDNPAFVNVAQAFNPTMNENNFSDSNTYNLSTKEQWIKIKKDIEHEERGNFRSQIKFNIAESEDKKFEIDVREDIYLEGYDQYSKEHPILVRMGKAQYHIIWNKLIGDVCEYYYIPNQIADASNSLPTDQIPCLDNIVAYYKFRKNDFKIKKPWFMKWRPHAVDYEQFMSSGINARFSVTQYVLDTLSDQILMPIGLKGIGRLDKDIYSALKFSELRYVNPPLLKDITSTTEFQLIDVKTEIPVGSLEFILPHKKENLGGYGSTPYIFRMGGIKLTVFGAAIPTLSTYRKIKEEIKWHGFTIKNY